MNSGAKRFWPLVALATMLSPGIAVAAPRCEISAYLNDPDAAGTNVRAAPSRDAKVLAHLPQKRGAEETTPEVVITGFSNGWAEIAKAEFVSYDEEAKDKVLFKGRGWIWGRLISGTLNDMVLRNGPSRRAPVAARLMGENWGPDSVLIVAMDDCLGAFARIRGRLPDGREVKGWAERICSNQVTTCP